MMTEQERYIYQLGYNVVHSSEVQAEMVAEILHQLPSSRCKFSKALLLELKALVQIKIWENAGLRPWLPKELPTYDEGFRELALRQKRGTAQLGNSARALEIINLVQAVTIRLYVLHKLTVASSSFMTLTHFSDEQLQLIADCLWDLRHLSERTTCHEQT